MPDEKVVIWADSVGKGVVFDEARGRYVILPDRCAVRLQQGLGLPFENHSRMGATVEEGFADFVENPARAGDVVVIAYGGNDCDMPWKEISADPAGDFDARVPLARFEAALREFVKAARARHMRPLLVTPPPLEAQRYFNWVTRGLSEASVLSFLGDVAHIYRWQERYSIAVRRVSQAMDCALFDLRDAFLASTHYPDLLCVDGIHPNAQGHALIAEAAVEMKDSKERQGLSAV